MASCAALRLFTFIAGFAAAIVLAPGAYAQNTLPSSRPPAVEPLTPPPPAPGTRAAQPAPRPAAPATSPAPVPPKEPVKLDPENTLYLDLEYGRVVIAMRPDLAPKHVARIKELVRDGFYDGVVFHRVIDGFMAQTGDPEGTGMGGSGQNIPAEFNRTVSHTRGIVSMARASNINSADSQWFIVLAASPFLDGNYTIWGEVVSGMEFVDQIRKGDPNANGKVPYPDRIVRLQVAADADKKR